MRTSLRLRHRRAFNTNPRGFTLLEILVVIVIVGVIVSMATIAIGVLGRDREMQDQAERVWAVLNQAKEECELQGFDVGLRVGTNSYDFLRFDQVQQQWLPIADDDLLGARVLPEGLRFRLWLEGREVVLKEAPQDQNGKESPDKATTPSASIRPASDTSDSDSHLETPTSTKREEKKNEFPPQILVLSSGDFNSFELQLERDGSEARWRVASKPDNTVLAEQVNDAT